MLVGVEICIINVQMHHKCQKKIGKYIDEIIVKNFRFQNQYKVRPRKLLVNNNLVTIFI